MFERACELIDERDVVELFMNNVDLRLVRMTFMREMFLDSSERG